LTHSKTTLATLKPAKTAGQPNRAPKSAPNGAPSDSEVNNPETAIASQVPRRCGGAHSPTSA
jgi:hypothetical protein